MNSLLRFCKIDKNIYWDKNLVDFYGDYFSDGVGCLP